MYIKSFPRTSRWSDTPPGFELMTPLSQDDWVSITGTRCPSVINPSLILIIQYIVYVCNELSFEFFLQLTRTLICKLQGAGQGGCLIISLCLSFEPIIASGINQWHLQANTDQLKLFPHKLCMLKDTFTAIVCRYGFGNNGCLNQTFPALRRFL